MYKCMYIYVCSMPLRIPARIYTYLYIYEYVYRERRAYTNIMQSLMRSQKSYACLMQSLMRSYAELPPACGPNGFQNHARNQPEFRQRLMLSVMRGLRRIRLFKIRASEFMSYAPLTPHKTFVE